MHRKKITVAAMAIAVAALGFVAPAMASAATPATHPANVSLVQPLKQKMPPKPQIKKMPPKSLAHPDKQKMPPRPQVKKMPPKPVLSA